MKWTHSLPSVALALTLALAAGGCAPPPPPPNLSSSNRNERLQAVRQVQEKWGATKPSKTANEQTIVGRWNHPWFDSVYLLFNADGTYRRTYSIRSDDQGTYCLLSDDILELNCPGFLGRWEYKYRLVGDTLEIKLGRFVTYTRAKP